MTGGNDSYVIVVIHNTKGQERLVHIAAVKTLCVTWGNGTVGSNRSALQQVQWLTGAVFLPPLL